MMGPESKEVHKKYASSILGKSSNYNNLANAMKDLNSMPQITVLLKTPLML